jgi:hypothetical protein
MIKNWRNMYFEYLSFFGNKRDGRYFFILPSIEVGWSSEHVYMAVSWLFWQYSVAFEL